MEGRDVDPSKPSIARLYDYVLGGKQHFEVDRRAARHLYDVGPATTQLFEDIRNHLRCAVRWLVREAGIRQFVDLGSGLPTVGNVHEHAQALAPDARVVYVDDDPAVTASSRALLCDETTTTAVTADIREPEAIFACPQVTGLIDLDRPFAVIASGILHHLDDDGAYDVAARVRARLRPGCYLVASNFLDDDEPRARQLERAFAESGLGIGRFRTWREQRRFFEDLELMSPVLVYADDWRPDRLTATGSRVHRLLAAGVARRS